MRIFGIDPGTVITGYGVIECEDGEPVLVDFGVVVSPENLPIGERLGNIYRELSSIVRRHQPDIVVVEQPFVAKNVRSALAIGRAQAVALLAATEAGIPACEYTPAYIKRMVANHGASTKEQVQEMVRLQLGLKEVPHPSDAADALAVAICHAREIHLSNLIARQDKGSLPG